MLPRAILHQIRRLQLRARRAVENLLGGEYHSIFKGSGIVFDEVREYQAGDDVRTIDWNVTARMGAPFIKRFVEERELTVMLIVDTSGSQSFGSGAQLKREVIAELAALLAFSAVSNNDRVGLIQFTEEVEKLVPPRKGVRHVLRLIRDILFYQPEKQGTNLANALDRLNRVLRRRAIVFLLSDFLDTGFEGALKRVGRRHDLIAIDVSDPLEQDIPAVGLVEVEDAETAKRLLVPTRSRQVREKYHADAEKRREQLRKWMREADCDFLEVSTLGNHLDVLLQFFRQRQRRKRG